MTAVALPPFWTLVETHGDELLVHARRLVGDAHAEDVVQEALLKALRAYPRLRHADHLRAWLYRITTTTAIDLHRVRRREVLTDDPPASAADPQSKLGGHPQSKLGGHPEYDDGEFDSLIAPLGDGARTALRLRFIEDLDYEGIAVRLDISPEAARQRVSSAVRTLRKRLVP